MVDEALGRAETGLAGVARTVTDRRPMGHADHGQVLPRRVRERKPPPALANHLCNVHPNDVVERADQAVAEIAKGIRTLAGLLTSEITSLRNQGRTALADIRAIREEIGATHREIRETLRRCRVIQRRAARPDPECERGEAEVIHEDN